MSQDQIPAALSEHTDKPIVEARFHLTEVRHHSLYGESGYGSSKAVTITMQAARSGIFGKASPSGKIELMIANPAAARIFQEAFDDADRRLHDEAVPAPKMGSKRYRVYFVEDEDQAPA